MGASNSRLSAPFYLVLSASNSPYDGTTLEPCAVYNGRTGLCAFGATVNSSTPSYVFDKRYSNGNAAFDTGFVQYNPAGGNTLQFDFRYSPISNVAFSQLVSPENATYGGLLVGFNGDTLEIPDNYDDTGAAVEGSVQIYARWQICNKTVWAGSNKPTLNWQLGKFKAQNPNCQSINVHKQNVES